MSSSYFFNTFKTDMRYIAESNLSDWDKSYTGVDKNNMGMNVLHLTASLKNVKDKSEKIDYLIKKGVSRELVDDCGFLPVDYLIKLIKNDFVMCKDYYFSERVRKEKELIESYQRSIEYQKKHIESELLKGIITQQEADKRLRSKNFIEGQDLAGLYHVWNNCVDIMHILPENIYISYGKSDLILKDKIQLLIDDINKHIEFSEPLIIERELQKKVLSDFITIEPDIQSSIEPRKRVRM